MPHKSNTAEAYVPTVLPAHYEPPDEKLLEADLRMAESHVPTYPQTSSYARRFLCQIVQAGIQTLSDVREHANGGGYFPISKSQAKQVTLLSGAYASNGCLLYRLVAADERNIILHRIDVLERKKLVMKPQRFQHWVQENGMSIYHLVKKYRFDVTGFILEKSKK